MGMSTFPEERHCWTHMKSRDKGNRRDMENKEKKKSVEARKKIICDLVRDPVYVPMKERSWQYFCRLPGRTGRTCAGFCRSFWRKEN